MDKDQKVLLELISAAINKKKPNKELLKNSDLTKVFELAKTHQVHTTIFPVLKEAEVDLPQNPIMDFWQKTAIVSGVKNAKAYEDVKEVIRMFGENGINVIAVKGLINRELYPYPELRTMGDVDLLVKDKDFKCSVELLKKQHYIESEKDLKHVHMVKVNSYCIELHHYLVNKRFVGDIPLFDSRIWDDLISVKLDDIPVLSLSLQHQLEYMCIHLAGHFLQDGFGLRQICDIVLFIKRYSNQIDWDRFFNDVKEYEIYGFVRALLLVCQLYFEMNLPEEIEFHENVDKPYIELFLEDILSGGIFGKRTIERIAANKRVNNYKRKEKTYALPYKIRNVIALLFPPCKLLGDTYYYAKRFPLLTPVAWVHRLAYDGLIKKKFTIREKVEILFSGKSEEIFRDRMKLMHWMNL